MSVASPVIDYIDPATRRIYLLAGITEYHPVEDIYKEVRNLRRTDESLRPYDLFVSAGGSLPKNEAGTERTPRYAIFHDCKVVLTGDTYISGEQLYEDDTGTLVGKGKDCIDRILSPADAYADYAPPEAEVIVVGVGTVEEITEAVLDTSLVDHQEHLTLGGVNVRDTYNGVVEVDILGGGAGQSFPTGMPHQRVNNIPDALILLDRYHLHTLKIHGDVPIPASTNLNGVTFVSGATLDRQVTIPNTCTTNGTKFRGVIIDGYMNGRVDIFNCEIENLYNFQGLIKESTLFKNITCVEVARASMIMDCVSGGVSANWPTLDIDNAKVEVRGWCGNLEVLGKTSDTITAIGMDCGILKLADTNVAGNIMVGGIGHLLEDNTGVDCEVSQDYLLNEDNIANAAWSHADGTFLIDVIRNKKALIKNGTTWELIIYNDAGDAQILNKELKDKSGNDITDLAAGALAQELATSV